MNHISEKAGKYLTENGVIAFKRIYVDVMGDVVGALFLSQLAYWQPRAKRNDGYVYKKYDDWEKETGLSSYQVKRCSEHAKKIGLIFTKLIRANGAPTIHYKINQKALTQSINYIIDNLDNEETPLTDNEETPLTLTETTSETTKDSSAEKKQRKSSKYNQATKELSAVFASVRKCNLPDWTKDPKGNNVKWATPLAAIWNAADKDLDVAKSVVTQATQRMMADRLTVVYPVQIETVALGMLLDRKQGSDNNKHHMLVGV